MEKQIIIRTIYSAIDEVNEQLPKSKQLSKSEDEILFGEGGKLDSLGLVNLIVNCETILDDEHEISITIADEKAMSMKNSPFRTVSTLADYIASIIGDNNE